MAKTLGSVASGRKTSKINHKRLVVLLCALLGAVLIAFAAYQLFSLMAAERRVNRSLTQAEAVGQRLSEVIQTTRNLLTDPQVQQLAKRALVRRESESDLELYLRGRMPDLLEYKLYPAQLISADPATLPDGGFTTLDMALKSKFQGLAPVQVIGSGDDQRMVGFVRLGSAEAIDGFLLIARASGTLLDKFNSTLPANGYIGLQQLNGNIDPTMLKQFGNSSVLRSGFSQTPIPGSLFAVTIPKPASTGDGLSLIPSLLLLALGSGLFAGGLIIYGRMVRAPKLLTAEATILPPPEARPGSGLPPLDGQLEEDRQLKKPEPVVAQEPPPVIIPPAPAKSKPEVEPVMLKQEIFRAYDIRGIIGESLDAGVAERIGQALGSMVMERNVGPLVVGRDGRLSGPDLVAGLIRGISASGCDVIDVGAVPTGVLYYAANVLSEGSGVMVTGSHNPPDYNGFKMMIGGDTLSGEVIQALYRRIDSGNLSEGNGVVSEQPILDQYRERIAKDIKLERSLKVVIDCGNGIAGVCAAEVLRDVGAEVYPLFDEVDGTFPNHHPDPSEPENLRDLIDSVTLMKADLGLAFDGDGDRLGVVSGEGENIFPDRVMMLFARDVLAARPGAPIIFDVKCTGHLATVIEEAGGEPIMWKTGHSLIKAKIKETGSPLAGEMSGHFFFGNRWYGFDDGIYAACRLLEILARREETPTEVLNALPTSVSTPELKVHMQEGETHPFIEEFRAQAQFDGADISTIDGLRADYPDGWGLVRSSNTTPVLVLRFDADHEVALSRIQEQFREQMLAINPDLELPF